MARIAISYRRSDSQDITGRIFDRLVQHFGKDTVFRDIDSIQPGIDFRTQIAAALGATDVLLVVVGPAWLGHGKGNANRMDNEADPVRIEVETALKRDIPIIPVLVGGIRMPEVSELPQSLRDFAYRHAVTVDGGRDFDHHMDGLIRSLQRMLHVPQGGKAGATRAAISPALYAVIGGLAVAVAAFAAVLLLRGSSGITPTFDCVKAEYEDEQAICRDSELIVLDQRLDAVYASTRGRLDADKRKTLAADENAWIAQRHSCKSDVTCIHDIYLKRIKILQAWQ
jgi:uncharacterized protein YecT (DUF1311 family)